MNGSRRDVLYWHGKLVEENRRLREEAERLCVEAKQKIEHLEWLVDMIHRQWKPDFFRPLHDAIRAMHGCGSRHLRSQVVRKVVDGQVRWVGMVEEFALEGVAEAEICYAWQYKEDGKPRTFTLLKQGTIDSPQAAVQFYLMAKDAPPAVKFLA